MRVELGNAAPVEHHTDENGYAYPVQVGDGRPAVTYWSVPDGAPYSVHPDPNPDELRQHAITRPGLLVPGAGPVVTHLPDHEAFVSVVNDWPNHCQQAPSWVSVTDDNLGTNADTDALQRALSGFWGAQAGRPDDVEDTHWTQYGRHLLPPGVGPVAGGPPELSKSNSSYDILWRTVFGQTAAGKSGTSTGTSATTMTDSGAAFGTNVYSGCMVQCANRIANILSHTGTVLTIDQWYDITNLGSTSAASTPAATSAYIIFTGAPVAVFMGLTANSAAVASGDTTLPSEITTASGGLIRKICPLAHTASATTGTLTPVFTANGSDALPVTIAKAGVSSGILSSVFNFTQTLFGTTATLSLSGDQLTVTDTYTLS